jgi:hypothetical protein
VITSPSDIPDHPSYRKLQNFTRYALQRTPNESTKQPPNLAWRYRASAILLLSRTPLSQDLSSLGNCSQLAPPPSSRLLTREYSALSLRPECAVQRPAAVPASSSGFGHIFFFCPLSGKENDRVRYCKVGDDTVSSITKRGWCVADMGDCGGRRARAGGPAVRPPARATIQFGKTMYRIYAGISCSPSPHKSSRCSRAPSASS